MNERKNKLMVNLGASGGGSGGGGSSNNMHCYLLDNIYYGQACTIWFSEDDELTPSKFLTEFKDKIPTNAAYPLTRIKGLDFSSHLSWENNNVYFNAARLSIVDNTLTRTDLKWSLNATQVGTLIKLY